MSLFHPSASDGASGFGKRKFAPAPPGHRYVQLCGKSYVDGEILLLPTSQIEFPVPVVCSADMGMDSNGNPMRTEWTDTLRFVATGRACDSEVWGVTAEIFELVAPKDGFPTPEMVA